MILAALAGAGALRLVLAAALTLAACLALTTGRHNLK